MAIEQNLAARTTMRRKRKRKQESIELTKMPSAGTQDLSASSVEDTFKLLDARFRSLDDPEARKRFLRQLLDQVKGLSMSDLLQLPHDWGVAAANMLMDDAVGGINHSDPLEKMLVEQLVVCHARVMELARLSTKQRELENALAIQEQSDKAMNAYRRGMLALKEYRTPSRSAPLVAVQQINQAQPSGAVNGAERASTEKNTTNELGTNPGKPRQGDAVEYP